MYADRVRLFLAMVVWQSLCQEPWRWRRDARGFILRDEANDDELYWSLYRAWMSHVALVAQNT